MHHWQRVLSVKKYMNKRGFTLVEIAVAAVVFAASIAGVFSTVSSFRVPLETSTKKLRAAQLSKKVLEGLRQDVWQNHPGPDPLSIGTHGPTADTDYPGYTYSYTVTDGTGTVPDTVDITVTTP
jgi:prepilin-type N-terminal cleavage/methylation domain-containing protein